MTDYPKYCPQCGGELDEDCICIRCGFDTREELDDEELEEDSENETWQVD